MPKELSQIIDGSRYGIKIIADVPIEWLPIRGLPLMLAHDTSRVPSTPGNLMFQQTLPPRRLHFGAQALSQILIDVDKSTADAIDDWHYWVAQGSLF